MRILSFLSFSLLVGILITSCGVKSVDVIIDKNDTTKTTVIIDDTLKLHLEGDTTVVLKMKPGKHTFTYKDANKQEFTVSKKGGLLNLDKSDYVVFEIVYKEVGKEDRFSFRSYMSKAIILVDSF